MCRSGRPGGGYRPGSVRPPVRHLPSARRCVLTPTSEPVSRVPARWRARTAPRRAEVSVRCPPARPALLRRHVQHRADPGARVRTRAAPGAGRPRLRGGQRRAMAKSEHLTRPSSPHHEVGGLMSRLDHPTPRGVAAAAPRQPALSTGPAPHGRALAGQILTGCAFDDQLHAEEGPAGALVVSVDGAMCRVVRRCRRPPRGGPHTHRTSSRPLMVRDDCSSRRSTSAWPAPPAFAAEGPAPGGPCTDPCIRRHGAVHVRRSRRRARPVVSATDSSRSCVCCTQSPPAAPLPDRLGGPAVPARQSSLRRRCRPGV